MTTTPNRLTCPLVRTRADKHHIHYSDVTMGGMASQLTSLTIAYSTVHSGADQRKHQSSTPLAFVWGIHRTPVNSPHKLPVTRKMFPFDDVIISTDRAKQDQSILRIHIGCDILGRLLYQSPFVASGNRGVNLAGSTSRKDDVWCSMTSGVQYRDSNYLWPVTHTWLWTGLSLVQAVACHIFDFKQLPKSMITCRTIGTQSPFQRDLIQT